MSEPFTAADDAAFRAAADREPTNHWANGNANGPEPFALALDEFLAAESDTPAALVGDEQENLLPAHGLAILYAKGGRGKTTLTIDAAFHFASGVEWLGFKLERELRVLVIENEGPREPFRRKLAIKRALWTHEIPGEIFVHVKDWGALVLNAESVGSLRAFIKDNRINIVIGDPLDSLGVRGVGSPEDTREFVKLLRATGLFSEVAFWLLHHPRKADSDDELDEVSGAWGGRCDTLLKLEKLDGNRARLSFPKIRWSRRGNRPASVLVFDPETEGFTVAHDEQPDERDYVTEIRELLADGEPRTVREITHKREDQEKPGIGAHRDHVARALSRRPDLFFSATGDAAKALGRHRNATVFGLVRGSVPDVPDVPDTSSQEDSGSVWYPTPSSGGVRGRYQTPPPSSRLESVPDVQDQTGD